MNDKALRWKVLNRDGFRCCYCGSSGGDGLSKIEIDHVVPKAWGGTDVLANLRTSCMSCYWFTRDRFNEQDWVSHISRKVPWGPSAAFWLQIAFEDLELLGLRKAGVPHVRAL